ncbi:MAG: TetR/AcrR family transcriptional regulator [Dehalococcoidia bacterium]
MGSKHRTTVRREARAGAAEAERPGDLRADALRNRDRILAAARDVIVEAGPSAPLDEIARRAGVGIGTLYRRFADREALLHAVALDVLQRVTEECVRALAEEPDSLAALARYMHRALDLRIAAVMPVLVSEISFADDAVGRARDASTHSLEDLLHAAQAAGTVRADVTFADIGLLLIRLSRPLPGTFPRVLDDSLAHRHLDIVIDGLRSAGDRSMRPLPGPALTLGVLREIPT